MEILKEHIRELKRNLPKKIGKERSYIAKVEKGETDIQLSSFLNIAIALNIQIFSETREIKNL